MKALTSSHRRTLRYCTTCPKMCRHTCPVAHVEARETVTPWGLVSALHAASLGVVPLDASLGALLLHCTGCLACQTACLHEIDVPLTVMAGRAALRRAQVAPVWHAGIDGDAGDVGQLDGPSLGFVATSAVGFFAGCLERSEDASAIRRYAAMFRAVQVDVELVVGAEPCCGALALQAGDEDAYAARALALARRLARFETVVTTCEELVALRRHGTWGEPWQAGGAPIQILHWTELMDEAVRLAGARPRASGHAGGLAYHDGCRLGRGAGVYDAPRGLLRWVTGVDAIELADHRDEAACCGAAAGYAAVAPDEAAELAEGVVGSAGGVPLVTASGRCAAHLEGAGPGARRVLQLDRLVAAALGVE